MGKPSPESAENAVEKRLEEVEIKLAFLEKELEEYKEVNRVFYRKINELEEELRKLKQDVRESDLPTPDVSWDPEGRNSLP